jgi:uncharacterized protein (TIGR03790 family)
MRVALGIVLLGLGEVLLATAAPATASSSGSEVVVIYNRNVEPDSRQVAEHYAARRGVPKAQLIGLALPPKETMTRAAFRKDLYRPLVQELEQRGLVQFEQQRLPAQEGAPGGKVRVLTASRVRYLVLAYGVPLRITPDKSLKEPGAEQLPAPLQRNEAAVDNELACLPLLERGALLTGPILNPFHGSTNAAALHPTNGLFLVSRLDGPSRQVAQRLVDLALQAEANGWWGRAYFDVRGLTNTAYVKGDEWIRAAYETARRQGFETVLDERPATFPAWFPMPQIALYAGWYDKDVSGPLGLDSVEFLPGAVAYHLHSFSAQTVREPQSRWVGPFLDRGVTATLGTVAEPYLDLSPNVGIFFTFLISLGCNFAEAAYLAQPVVSWQTTVIGDPLYRPMARPPADLHAALEQQDSEWLPWSHLRVVNLNLANHNPTPDLVPYLETLALTPRSALLSEKLGRLYSAQGKLDPAIAQYRAALRLQPSPQQAVALQLLLIQLLIEQGKSAEALEVYDAFFDANPHYPDLIRFYREALPLARQLRDERRVADYLARVEKLTPPPAAATTNQSPAGKR